MRVAYVWPSGEIANNRYVHMYYAGEPRRLLDEPINVGDLFVTEASLALTAPERVLGVDPRDLNPSVLGMIREESDIVFVRGANTLADESFAEILADFIEKIDKNVVVMGIGIQAPSRDRLPSGGAVQRLSKMLGERSRVIGVRGEITADFLSKQGVTNVQIVGCPSLLRHNKRDLSITKPEWCIVSSFGFSLTRSYGNLYQRDNTTFLSVQSQLIKELHSIGRVGLITQVEKEEKAFALRDPAEMDVARTALRRAGWFDTVMESIYDQRCVFFGTSAGAYDMHVRNFDVVFGSRLHTNAMAVACGVPAITLTFDLRVEEIYDFWRLPRISVEDARGFSARELYERADFAAFNSRVGFIYDNFRRYLEANGVVHVMNPGT